MRFTDWIEKAGRKVLLTDRVKNGNRLIRRYNRENGGDVSQVDCITLQSLVWELFLAWQAGNGFCEKSTFLTPDSCVYLLDELIQEGNCGFLPKECYCIKTTEAVLQSLNQIRMNETTEAFEQENSEKIVDLKRLIQYYEERLRGIQCYDYALVLKEILPVLEDIEDFSWYLPWVEGCSLGILEDLEFTAKEKTFWDKFVELTGCPVEVLEYYSVENPQKSVDYEFFKAYGPVNEIRYVADQIAKKKIPYGEVSLFYTTPEYEPFIKGVFGERGIPYYFINGEKATSDEVVQFALAVLEFVQEDFLYERLCAVVENPLMTFYRRRSTKSLKGMEKPVRSYNHFLKKGIGWGKERYKECIERVETQEEEKRKYQHFLAFLKNLLYVFEGGNDCGELYRRLVKFVCKYTRSGKSVNSVKAVLKEQIPILEQVTTKTQEDSIQMIKEHLKGLVINREGDNGVVHIIRVNHLEVLERSYQFIIGLSAKQFLMDTKESPVLSDEELVRYIQGKIETAEEAGKRVRENLQRTLATLNKGTIFMGYITYDTIHLKESAPSVFYLEYEEKYGQKKSVEEYKAYAVERGDVKLFVGVSGDAPQTDFEEDEIDLEEYEDAYEEEDWYEYEEEYVDVEEDWYEEELMEIEEDDDFEEGEKTPDEVPESSQGQETEDEAVVVSVERSPSAVQSLMKCPLQYYYHYVKWISGREFQEKDNAVWLDAAQKGNLFHWTLEAYCEAVFMNTTSLAEKMNENLFEAIYANMVLRMLQEQPYASESVYKQEVQENHDGIRDYLKRLHEELYKAHQKGKKWQILGCETKFEKLSCRIENPDKQQKEKLEILFNGSIDRLDGYVDDSETLRLRVVDYKTGKRENKEKELNSNEQIQHLVYAFAACKLVREKADVFQKKLGASFKTVAVESVQYVFPYEEQSILDVTEKLQGGQTNDVLSLPAEVVTRLWEVQGNISFGREEEALGNIEAKLDKLSKTAADRQCKYCDYRRLCRRRLGREL